MNISDYVSYSFTQYDHSWTAYIQSEDSSGILNFNPDRPTDKAFCIQQLNTFQILLLPAHIDSEHSLILDYTCPSNFTHSSSIWALRPILESSVHSSFDCIPTGSASVSSSHNVLLLVCVGVGLLLVLGAFVWWRRRKSDYRRL